MTYSLAIPRSYSGSEITVEFSRNGDRFAHRVNWRSTEGIVSTLLKSAEGDDSQAWPPSPPLQQCHPQELPHGLRTIMGVGRAGRSHWSLVVEAHPDNVTDWTSTGSQLVFDVACRCPQEGWLGSTYEVASEANATVGEECGYVEWQLGGEIWRLETIPPFVGSSRQDQPFPSRMSHQGQRLSIAALQVPAPQYPATIRWKYRLYMASPGAGHVP
ncbi:MAG: hypothetical protein R3E01_21530 [Pirellulaceae bacterium]|nr:hypothetical protein [Planctomycetales bacterium]